MESREIFFEMIRGNGIKGYIKKKLYNHINACFQIVLDSIDKNEIRINEQFYKLNDQETKINDQETKINEQSNKLNEQATKINEQNNVINNLNEEIKHLKFDNNYLKKQLKGLKNSSRDDLVTDIGVIKEKEDSYVNLDYFDFENHFRGSIESIKERQQMYVKYFLDRRNILDIGCGRGEFLSLMKENNITAKGIDIYEEYVEYCRSNGLEAVTGDGIAYLHNSNEKYGGIFVGQVIEHLNLNDIVSICNDAYSKLEAGASIIFETPNPRCLSTYVNAFYVDPTHMKPVHPFTMKYFLEKAGFKCVRIINTSCSKETKIIPQLNIDVSDESKKSLENFNHMMSEISELLFGSQDYAIIATKITRDVDWNYINFIPLMYKNENVSVIDDVANMSPKGLIFGPYIHLSKGIYDIHVEVSNDVSTSIVKITSDKGIKSYKEEKIKKGDNCIRIVLDNDVHDVEFVVCSNDDYVNINSIWYEVI